MSKYNDYVKGIVKNNVNNWISNKREKISLDNSALFKGKDIGFLRNVVDYLHKRGLEPKLAGSVVKNALDGNPRQYSDIDLVVETKTDLFRKKPELREEFARLYRYSNGTETHPEWEVEDLSKKYALYVGMVINSRFRIKSKKTKTTIDLSFGIINDY